MTAPDLGQDFKRSKRFGLIGVAVVAALTAAIALLFGSGSARPTGALVAILAIVFGFFFVLLVVQRRDIDRAEARGKRAQLAPAGPVDDPTTVDAETLLAALAVKPIDHVALVQASARTWSMARGSLRSAGVLMVLIFCAVVPWQLFTAYWSIYVFVPVIAAYAGFLAVRAVRIDGARATTALGGTVPEFLVHATGERLRAEPDGPAEVAEALAALRASSYWRGVAVSGGANGIVVERERDGAQPWMRDLWLAERLADALAPGRRR